MKLLPVRFWNIKRNTALPIAHATRLHLFFRHLLLELHSSEKQKPSNVDLEEELVIQSEVLMNCHKGMILLLVWEDQDQIMDNLTGLLRPNVMVVSVFHNLFMYICMLLQWFRSNCPDAHVHIFRTFTFVNKFIMCTCTLSVHVHLWILTCTF